MITSTPISAAAPPIGAELVARHLAERCGRRAAIEKNRVDEVLHAAAQHRADEDPQRARQVAELRRQRRADQRPGAGDGGEVVAEHDPAVGRHEVAAVVEALGRRGARGVEDQHLGRDEGAVEAVADGIDADRRDDEPEAVDGLAAVQRDAADSASADGGDEAPNQDTNDRIPGLFLVWHERSIDPLTDTENTGWERDALPESQVVW